MDSTVWSTTATVAVMLAIGALLRSLSNRGKWPRLPEPDPAQVDTTRDRLRYYLANTLAVLIGVVAGLALWLLPPQTEEGMLFRSSAYDHVGRLIGPMFFGLGAGGLVLPPITMRLVAPGPLLHILTRSAMRQVKAPLDLLPALRWLSSGILVVALLVHLAVRSEHLTFDEVGVRWHTWPWQGERAQRWQDVTDVRLVSTFTAPTGNVVERKHLSVGFQDGSRVHFGRQDDAKSADIERAAKIAAERSGHELQRVERE